MVNRYYPMYNGFDRRFDQYKNGQTNAVNRPAEEQNIVNEAPVMAQPEVIKPEKPIDKEQEPEGSKEIALENGKNQQAQGPVSYLTSEDNTSQSETASFFGNQGFIFIIVILVIIFLLCW